MLPKIHKQLNTPLGKPIVLGAREPTEKISQQVDYFINLIVPVIKIIPQGLTPYHQCPIRVRPSIPKYTIMYH